MSKKSSIRPKIDFIIERFFIIAGVVILASSLTLGFYFNKYDEKEKRKNNLQKIHSMLSQLIVPSLIISDLSEVRRLLYMASGDDETFLVIDSDRIVIMSDYGKSLFSQFISNTYLSIDDCKKLAITYQYIGDKWYLVNCSRLKTTDVLSNENDIGVLVSFSTYKFFFFSPLIFYFIGILIFLFLVLIILLRRMLYRQLLQPLVILKDKILDISNSVFQTRYIHEIKNAPRELLEIKNAFEKLLLSLQEEYQRSAAAEKMKALIDLAAGVAHDIRSPLTALDVFIKDIKNIPEDQRVAIRDSVNRINDIANNLLTQYREKKNEESDKSINQIKPELIADLLVSLVSEKRAKYKNNEINLSTFLEEKAYGKFALISSSSLKRVLSNLIDNAIEAFATNIQVNLLEKANLLVIQIQDNGCGISEDILSKIVSGEQISNKLDGHGLGLPHAIKAIEKEWGGKLKINSFINKGTTIDVYLPKIPPPKWFLSELIVNPDNTIVIVDDDESIHRVWKERFKSVYAIFNFIHHYHSIDFLNWSQNHSLDSCVFLIDYELIGSHKNGLNLIEELDISGQSYLVTSRHEDVRIREYSEKIGLKIIPKNFAVYIPIFLLKNDIEKNPDLIFIDDDAAMRSAWIMRGKLKNKIIAAYHSANAFKIKMNQFDFTIPIYIDSDLNDVIKGEEFAKELYEIGFKNIYLCTGYQADHFSTMYWVKDIVGKEPVF